MTRLSDHGEPALREANRIATALPRIVEMIAAMPSRMNMPITGSIDCHRRNDVTEGAIALCTGIKVIPKARPTTIAVKDVNVRFANLKMSRANALRGNALTSTAAPPKDNANSASPPSHSGEIQPTEPAKNRYATSAMNPQSISMKADAKKLICCRMAACSQSLHVQSALLPSGSGKLYPGAWKRFGSIFKFGGLAPAAVSTPAT
jgi:hypothetical protein